MLLASDQLGPKPINCNNTMEKNQYHNLRIIQWHYAMMTDYEPRFELCPAGFTMVWLTNEMVTDW